MFNKAILADVLLLVVAVIGMFVFWEGDPELQGKSCDAITSDTGKTNHTEIAGQDRPFDFNGQRQKNIRHDFPVFYAERASGEKKNVQDSLLKRKNAMPEDGVASGGVYSKDELSKAFSAQKYESSKMSGGSEEFDLLLARQAAYYLESVGNESFNKDPPAGDNMEASLQDEFAEQIDQALITEQEIVAGYYFGNPSQAADGLRDDSAIDLAKGDYYYEINQQDIFANAKIERGELPEAAPNAPVESNMSTVPRVEYSGY